jgi:ketohexokinase
VTRRWGGNCPNTLQVLQQLTSHESTENGLPLTLITVLPSRSSVASQQIISSFAPGINLDHCLYQEEFDEPASCYIIKSQSTGSRTIVNYNDLPEMTLEEFTGAADTLGHEATWFHFEVWLLRNTLRAHNSKSPGPNARDDVDVYSLPS